MDKKLTVIICEPNEPPRVEHVKDRLEVWQDIVGGMIDVIYPHDDDSCIILNDEGKIINLPINRPLKDEDGNIYDVMCGTFVIVRGPEDSDAFESLTDEQVEKYLQMYAEPITEIDAPRFAPLAEPRMEFIPFGW